MPPACWRAPNWVEPTTVPGNLDTLMAGLACGEPSVLAWQELNHAAAAFMAIPDAAAVACMRLLAEHGIVGGESGVAGLAGCLLAAADPAARETLGLEAASRVLLFNTEGATDPALYRKLTGWCGTHRLEAVSTRDRRYRSQVTHSCVTNQSDVPCSRRRLLSQPVVTHPATAINRTPIGS